MIQPADSASDHLKSVMHHVEGLRRECDSAAPWPLEVLLASELGPELKDRLRTVPVQRRSMQTVDRMFSATLEIALRSKDIANLKIEDIAQTSGVTVTAGNLVRNSRGCRYGEPGPYRSLVSSGIQRFYDTTLPATSICTSGARA